eukprot:CAMPEP_0185376086 /NCGR_PEP_ID=MMETSP1364-20130426/38241_1 /TAXON_ID=38817 /ORGANISM="Gephyrocapsa oceanica, Strain RCC1303" /LENGTH=59 /DNA_ID=CAMNT_0027977453 /DNA_START=33 /DNA_END=210 /DNA_ORIENTATION=+
MPAAGSASPQPRKHLSRVRCSCRQRNIIRAVLIHVRDARRLPPPAAQHLDALTLGEGPG